jgi:hypothetical protein
MLASVPASRLNQTRADLGIPSDSVTTQDALARAMSMDFPGAFPAVFRLGAERDGAVSATVMVRVALAE